LQVVSPSASNFPMLRVLFVVLYLVLLTFSTSGDISSSVNFTIGALLSGTKFMKHFNLSICDIRAHVNEKQISFTALTEVSDLHLMCMLLIYTFTIYMDIKILASNALTATKQLCSMISAGNARFFAVVVSNPPNSPSTPPLSISYVAALYGLPVIGVSTRQAAFSNKYAHASFLRTVPPYVEEAKIWAQLISVFEWHEMIIIHSDNNHDSKALIARLEAARQTVDFKITQTIGVNTDEEDVVNLKELQHKVEPIQRGQTRVILLFVTRRYAEHVFTVADRLGIIGKEWAWIVSEQCLGAKNLPLGALSVRLAQSDELRHVEDAARVVTEGIIKFTRREPKIMFGLQSVHHCRQELESPRNLSQSWLYYNTKLYQAMTEVIFEDGETGHVEFDSHGDRVGALYDIVNVQPHSDCGVPKPSCKPVINTVGKYVQAKRGSKKPRFSIEIDRIYWPGNYRAMKPSDICTKRNSRTNECIERAMRPRPPPSSKKKTHLKVVTIQSTPFVDYVPKPSGGQCNTSDRVEDLKFQVPCTHTNATTGASACYLPVLSTTFFVISIHPPFIILSFLLCCSCRLCMLLGKGGKGVRVLDYMCYFHGKYV
uniref:ANF_receptor domain-containing protein n=1 Tax=Hymenolepis diminuta TaxID=6216 RepID=A0A158QED3_HYMDI